MRVLVADDDAVSGMLLQTAVEEAGHACVLAADGEDAWVQVRRDRPDVVVTDRMMPGLDGIELCRRVRDLSDDGPYTYVVLATALRSPQDIAVGMEAGADDYLIKPIDPFDLRMRLLAAERVTTLQRRLASSRTELERLVHTDALTGVGNRRRFDEDLLGQHARATRGQRPYALALCDVDCFKEYNDAHGHQRGDETLRRVAAAILSAVRLGDEVYRYGGEEFAVLYHAEDADGAAVGAERLRRSVEALEIVHEGSPAGVVTVSIGVSEYRGHPERDATDVLAEADEAMYRAKRDGRNLVRTAREPAPRPGDETC